MSYKKTGKKTLIASDTSSLCIGDPGSEVKNDVNFYYINENNFAGIIFISGKGVKNYLNNLKLHSIVNKFYQEKKVIGAICWASMILAKAGI